MTQYYDYLESSFELESILPLQFFEKKKEAMEPVKRLMLAVLADAVRCYQTGLDARATSRRRAFLEAERWFFGLNTDGLFSFENVCCVLDITPDYLRQMLRKWRAKKTWPCFRPRPPLTSDLSEANECSDEPKLRDCTKNATRRGRSGWIV
jgi:hypothetical protein